MLRATATVDGLAVGIWGVAGGRVELEPFGRLAADGRAALEADAGDVHRFAQAS